MKVHKLSAKKGDIPGQLLSIPDAPRQLFYLGDSFLELANMPIISIVGSRKVSPYGRAVTEKLAGELARQRVVIASGLALGVDAIALRAAIEHGGKAIAIMPCGLNRIYPATNYNLAKEILKGGGALASEYPEGIEPRKENFIARNRLVSGISRGLLITEAAEKSGTLHTANFALEQGREVMAVPGNITNLLSVGTNNLIKAGAVPVTSVQDILNTLGLEVKDASQQELFAANNEELAILKLMGEGVTDGEELLLKSKLNPILFSQTLTMLEIGGKVKSAGGNQWLIY